MHTLDCVGEEVLITPFVFFQGSLLGSLACVTFRKLPQSSQRRRPSSAPVCLSAGDSLAESRLKMALRVNKIWRQWIRRHVHSMEKRQEAATPVGASPVSSGCETGLPQRRRKLMRSSATSRSRDKPGGRPELDLYAPSQRSATSFRAAHRYGGGATAASAVAAAHLHRGCHRPTRQRMPRKVAASASKGRVVRAALDHLHHQQRREADCGCSAGHA